MIFRLFAVLFRLALLPFFLVRNARAVPRGAFVAIEIDGGVADIVRAPRLWEMWRPHAATSLHATFRRDYARSGSWRRCSRR